MLAGFSYVVAISLLESVVAFRRLPSGYLGDTLTHTFLYLLPINLTFYAAYILVLYPFFLNPLRRVPIARGFKPVIGHALTMFSRPAGVWHLRIMKETPNDGLIRTLGFFHSDTLLATSPEALADVLVHKNYDFEKPPWVRQFLRKFLGNGLLITEGDEHKHHRKQIMPAFHFRHIKELYPVFWSKSVDMCNVIRASLTDNNSDTLDVGHYATQVTLDIIGLAGLGRNIDSLKNSDDELVKNYEVILEPTAEKAIYFIMHLIFPARLIAMLPWKVNKEVKDTTGNLSKICTDFVVDKKSGMKHESRESVDILSIMIRSNNFSDQNLVDQLLTFLAAG
jgi:cytochrome P450